MSRYAELTDAAATRALETLKPVEDVTVKVAGAVEGLVRTLPTLPWPEALPRPAEVVEVQLSLAQRALTAQQDFLLRVLSVGAASPLVPEQGELVETATSTRV